MEYSMAVTPFSILSIILFGLPNIVIRFSLHQKTLLGRHFWARGYFCATAGQVTDEMIKSYLEHHFESNPNDDFRTEA